MNKIKLEYEQPSCNLLVVRFEQGILTVSQQYGTAGSAGRRFSSANGNIIDLTDEDDF